MLSLANLFVADSILANSNRKISKVVLSFPTTAKKFQFSFQAKGSTSWGCGKKKSVFFSSLQLSLSISCWFFVSFLRRKQLQPKYKSTSETTIGTTVTLIVSFLCFLFPARISIPYVISTLKQEVLCIAQLK